jgi:hypothetical protein
MPLIDEYAAYREVVTADARAWARSRSAAELAAFDRDVAALRAACSEGGTLPWTDEVERGALMIASALKAWAIIHHDEHLLSFVRHIERKIVALEGPL